MSYRSTFLFRVYHILFSNCIRCHFTPTNVAFQPWHGFYWSSNLLKFQITVNGKLLSDMINFLYLTVNIFHKQLQNPNTTYIIKCLEIKYIFYFKVRSIISCLGITGRELSNRNRVSYLFVILVNLKTLSVMMAIFFDSQFKILTSTIIVLLVYVEL